MQEVYRVGIYIEDEFTTFAICTTIKSAEKAKQLLSDGGLEDVEIEMVDLYFDTISINDVTYNLLDE